MTTFKEYINESNTPDSLGKKYRKEYEEKISKLLLKKIFISGSKRISIKRDDKVTIIKFRTASSDMDEYDLELQVQKIIDKLPETDELLGPVYNFRSIDSEIEVKDTGIFEKEVSLILTYS